jgi:zinc/manganese transport system ATP-binding protein
VSVSLQGLRLPLAHFTLEVDAVLEGRVTAIFGASGAGKTSLLEVIAGLRQPAAGLVRVDGAILTHPAAHIFVPPHQRAIGYVPQEGALFPHLSVSQNLRYGHTARAAAPAGLTFPHVADVLELTALTERPIGPLSGGEKQRVALGRALLAAPRLLLLDEPLAGLDPRRQQAIVQTVDRVRKELDATVLFSAHDVNPLLGVLDQVLYLGSGHAVLGTVDEVVNGPVLSRLYGTPIEVVRHGGRIFVMAGNIAAEDSHHVHDV